MCESAEIAVLSIACSSRFQPIPYSAIPPPRKRAAPGPVWRARGAGVDGDGTLGPERIGP